MQKKILIIVTILAAVLLAAFSPLPVTPIGPAAVAPDLGTAASFIALAASTLTNTGSGNFYGDVGVSPGLSIIGFPPGMLVNGMLYPGGSVPLQAQIDASTAYTLLSGQTCNVDYTGVDLGGLTLAPGVYCFDTSAQLTGNLVLDGMGDPNAVWVFQTGSTLITSSTSTVSVINGGNPLNVFWKVGSSATLGTGTRFIGNIIANGSATMNTGASLTGRIIALTGAVTMDTTGSPPIANVPLRNIYLPIVQH